MQKFKFLYCMLQNAIMWVVISHNTDKNVTAFVMNCSIYLNVV